MPTGNGLLMPNKIREKIVQHFKNKIFLTVYLDSVYLDSNP